MQYMIVDSKEYKNKCLHFDPRNYALINFYHDNRNVVARKSIDRVWIEDEDGMEIEHFLSPVDLVDDLLYYLKLDGINPSHITETVFNRLGKKVISSKWRRSG